MTATRYRFPWGLLGMLVLVRGRRAVRRAPFRRVHPARRLRLGDRRKGRRSEDRGRDILVFGTSMTQQGLLPPSSGRRSEARRTTCPSARTGAGGLFPPQEAPWTPARDRRLCSSTSTRSSSPAWTVRARATGPTCSSRPSASTSPGPRGTAQILRPHDAGPRPAVDPRPQPDPTSDRGGPGRRGVPLPAVKLRFAHNKNQNGGALVYPPKATYRGEVDPAYSRIFVPEGWAVDRVNETYLRRFVALAASRGIEVYCVIPPLCPELQGHRNKFESTRGATIGSSARSRPIMLT